MTETAFPWGPAYDTGAIAPMCRDHRRFDDTCPTCQRERAAARPVHVDGLQAIGITVIVDARHREGAINKVDVFWQEVASLARRHGVLAVTVDPVPELGTVMRHLMGADVDAFDADTPTP